MKRYFVLAASVCALFMALAAGPAFAGSMQPGPIALPVQTGGDNGQSNTAILSNVPVLSGNSVAVVNTGDQSSSANTDLSQVNTDDTTGGNGGNTPADSNQSNTAVLSNDPVASGNSVAVVNGGRGCGCQGTDGGGQTSSADATLSQVNSSQGSPESNGKWETGSQDQSNTAILSNDPVASGNSVALVNVGGQSSSANANLSQVNQSTGGKSGSWKPESDGNRCGCNGKEDHRRSKSDDSGQSNTAILSNDPVASGNSVALVNVGGQSSSANANLAQVNQSTGGKSGSWKPESDGNRCGCNGKEDHRRSKSDDSGQSNTAILSNDPVASGNSVALVNVGGQSSSANANLSQVNQSTGGKQGSWKQESKPCPKPKPKPCDRPKPKPCHPKPCPPKPCPPKPCPPAPCNGLGIVTAPL